MKYQFAAFPGIEVAVQTSDLELLGNGTLPPQANVARPRWEDLEDELTPEVAWIDLPSDCSSNEEGEQVTGSHGVNEHSSDVQGAHGAGISGQPAAYFDATASSDEHFEQCSGSVAPLAPNSHNVDSECHIGGHQKKSKKR